jgi:transcriptional regulator with XRE-family HTH domain
MALQQTADIPNPPPNVAGRIRMARRFADLAQRELGVAIGVSRETVSHWERGLFPPTTDNILAIAEAVGVRPGWFLDGLPPPRARTAGWDHVWPDAA